MTVFRSSDPHILVQATDRLDGLDIPYVIEQPQGPQWLELHLGAYEITVEPSRAEDAARALIDLSSEYKLPIPGGGDITAGP